ncbi:MAG: DUF4339 domain-containing protein [Microthrixaceae bacterium]|nr:DUF4339 domain-containing protein [Microthrixaceae bacterium]
MSDLPPLDEPHAWIVVRGTEQAGPYPLNVLIDEVVAQRLPDNTPVWWPPLADWTTLSAQPVVAAEVARRRSLVTPGWAPPPPGQVPVDSTGGAMSPQTGSQAMWSSEPVAPESPSVFGTADSQVACAEEPVQSYEPAQTYEPVQSYEVYEAEVDATPAADPSSFDEAEIADAVVIEAAVPEIQEQSVAAETSPQVEHVESVPVAGSVTSFTSGLEGSVRSDFAQLVARSKKRADRLEAVGAVDEKLVSGAVSAAGQCGFVLTERVDVNGNHEMRFNDESGTSLLVISLAELAVSRVDDISSAVLAVTISVRIDGAQSVSPRSVVDGEHGQIAVRPDDWTGQTTSTVSLYLGADDYVNADLVVDSAGVERDFRAAIESLKTALT